MAGFGSSNLVVNGIDITALDDDELFTKLEVFGAVVGPVVDTTRKVYQRKLFVLMGGHLDDPPTFNGDVDVDDDEYSDNDDDVVEVDADEQDIQILRETVTTTSPDPSHISDIRKRVLMSSGGESEVADSGVVFDPDRHTPSPRRSLRTVTSSSSESITVTRFVNNGRSGIARAGVQEDITDSPSPAPSKTSSCLRLLVKLLFLALIAAVAFYFYQSNPDESPFKAVEHMARQALEAAVGEETGKAAGGKEEAAAAPPEPAAAA